MTNRILKAVRWLLAGLLCGALTIISFQIEYNTPRHDHCRGYLQNEFRRMCSHGYSTGRILRGRKSPDHRPHVHNFGLTKKFRKLALTSC